MKKFISISLRTNVFMGIVFLFSGSVLAQDYLIYDFSTPAPHVGQWWMTKYESTGSSLGESVNTNDFTTGTSSLELDYALNHDASWAEAAFWMVREHEYKLGEHHMGVSLDIKVVEPVDDPFEDSAFSLIFRVRDADGADETYRYSFGRLHAVDNSEWQTITIPFEDFVLFGTETDGVFNKNDIREIRFVLSHSGTDYDAPLAGKLLLDNLVAVESVGDDPGMPDFALLTPAGDSELDIDRYSGASVDFTWEAVDYETSPVYYLLIDMEGGDFSSPVLADSVGTGNGFSLSHTRIDNLLEELDVDAGDGFITLDWTVSAQAEGLEKLASAPFSVTFNRKPGDYLIYGFDTQFDVSSWWMAHYTSTGATYDATLNTEDKTEGEASLDLDYSVVNEHSWGGEISLFFQRRHEYNLEGFEGVSFDYKIIDPIDVDDNLRFFLQFRIQSSNNAEERWRIDLGKIHADASGEWQTITIPFDDFSLSGTAEDGIFYRGLVPDEEPNAGQPRVKQFDLMLATSTPPDTPVVFDGRMLIDNLMALREVEIITPVEWVVGLEGPADVEIIEGQSISITSRVYAEGLTDIYDTAIPEVSNAWIGYSDTDTDPSGDEWTWIEADFTGRENGAHQYSAEIGSTLSEGSYYYASRFLIADKDYHYGGYSDGGGGTWDGETNVSGVLKVTKKPTDLEIDQVPVEFSLSQNYPNPFNPTTQIKFGLPETSDVLIEVYTLTGQKVATLVNGQLSAGYHTVSLDGTHLSSGIYIYRIQSGDFVKTRKLTLVK